MFVTLKTIPNYCTAMQSQQHIVPGISIVFFFFLNFLLILFLSSLYSYSQTHES